MTLRTASILTVGLSLIVCPPSFSDEPQMGQQAAIAAIEKLGGEVIVDEKCPNAPAVEVYLSGPKITDADLKLLNGMTELRSLYLGNTKVTDAGLIHLKGLTKLQALNLSSTNVSDAGMVFLKGMTKLRCLQLTDTKINDTGLEHLKGLTKLQTPLLGNTMFFVMPKKRGDVVAKGSFSVWTVPEDPLPAQNYVIVIQIKLSKEVTHLRRSDLSGMLVGTDGYRQTIPGIRCGWMPVKGNQAQLGVFVPAAAKLVKDTINVRSKTLKETQTLEIVF